MPIRINLLAEAQAAEELRRKDPVKRAIVMGAGCIVLMTLASLFLQSQTIRANRTAKGYGDRISAITNDYAAVMQNTERLQEVNLNIRGLDILASERFLHGTLLNAIQQVYVDHVQLVQVRSEQTYSSTAETRDKATKRVTKPGTATEQITLVIEARDASPNPGDQVNKFKESFAQNSYFQNLLGESSEMRLVNLSPPQLAGDLGQLVVQFTLETRLAEKIRLDISSPTRYAPTSSTAKSNQAQKAPTGPVKL